jgi:LmbE family N-acetylglucosaminyl deacetylase
MQGKNVLIVAAHPDDAELAVGGLIAMLADRGARVSVANFTVCEASPEARRRRITAAENACRILGAEVIWVGDSQRDHVEDVPEYRCVAEIDKLVADVKPDYVLSHHLNDSHGDHVRLARSVMASSRRWDAQLFAFGPNEYRTPAYQAFVPTLFVDTSTYLDRKLEALSLYNYSGAGFRPIDLARIEALDRAKGAMCGYQAAEGLMIVRQHGFPMSFATGARPALSRPYEMYSMQG